MSLRSFFRGVEKFVRPIVRPAAAALTAIYAPAALPLVQGALGLRTPGQAPPEIDPGGYFPQPPRVAMAHAPFEYLLEASGFAPNIPISNTPRLLAEGAGWAYDAYEEAQDELEDLNVEEM
jgi:hypothetical protein